nr:EOG090X04K8 [Lepidurus arcticus]
MDMRKRPSSSNDKEHLLSYHDDSIKKDDDDNKSTGLGKDKANVALLFFLYLLQGIPLGLASAIPMILQNRHISYKEQAQFSLVYWPFSLKLLWAPIVDSWYCNSMGRRKTWLVPSQYLLGLCMIYLSTIVGSLLGETGEPPNVQLLTAAFFVLNFLAATQDIAVDGWALTMLDKRHVGYASTCNSVGQTAGYFFGYIIFMALESADFCNKYLRAEPFDKGFLTLADFLYYWGIIFMITTSIVWFAKCEKAATHIDSDEPELGIVETYKLLWDIIKLPSMKTMIIFLLTCKIGFSVSDAVTGLKLVEAGVPKAQLALLAIPLVPLQIVLPLLISRYTTGPSPMNVFLKAIPFRLLFGVEYALLLFVTPYFNNAGEFSMVYYGIVLLSYCLHQITVYSMFVAVMSFFAKISDPAVGGTYMTLLNTLCNLGGNWPTTLALWVVDPLTIKSCCRFSSHMLELSKTKNTNISSYKSSLASLRDRRGNCDDVVIGTVLEEVIKILGIFLEMQLSHAAIKYEQALTFKHAKHFP